VIEGCLAVEAVPYRPRETNGVEASAPLHFCSVLSSVHRRPSPTCRWHLLKHPQVRPLNACEYSTNLVLVRFGIL
jgi:hypothetical protein